MTAKSDILALPYGSGSGCENPAVHGNGYVFCIRIGDSDKPWFRYVAGDKDWKIIHDDTGLPRVSGDTLISLRIANPGSGSAPRWLDVLVYGRAFTAGEIARSNAYTAWSELTGPEAFQPDMPLSFRDAHQLIFRAGGDLG